MMFAARTQSDNVQGLTSDAVVNAMVTQLQGKGYTER